MITLLTTVVIVAVILYNLILIIRWQSFFKEYPSQESESCPFVSILVAVRNEERNIERCLNSLLHQNYPKDNYEILVGDDQSDDHSLKILREYERNNSCVKVLPIETTAGNARGKANVLAELSKLAMGKHYLITDADIKLPTTWIKGMIAGLRANIGIVVGFTRIEDNHWQNIDWLFALGMVKVFTDASTPVTGMGNNMLVTKEAYESVGGYETIPFSVTEDYELFRQVSRKGYKTIHVASKEVLASSKSIRGFYNLLIQRKRWMKGAVRLPWPIKILLLLNALYFPAIISAIIINPIIGVLIGLFKLTVQSIFIRLVADKLKIPLSTFRITIFEFYSLIVTIATSLYYLIPTGVKWKGRKY